MTGHFSFKNFFERTINLDNIIMTFTGNEAVSNNIPMKILPPIPHSHVYGELFFCEKGELTIFYKEQSLTITEGDIAFIPPNVYHRTHPGEDSETYIFGIIIKKHNVKHSFEAYELVSSLFNADTPLYFKRNLPISPENMNWVYKISTSDHLIYTLSGAQTLIALSKSYKKHSTTPSNKNPKKKNANLIMNLESYIDAHYFENFAANDLAAMLYISPRQLARIVNEKYKAPLHKVIIRKRIESAAQLLRETNLSVETIISSVGFSTKTSFYKAFNSEYGMTPFQYKKQQQNKKEA